MLGGGELDLFYRRREGSYRRAADGRRARNVTFGGCGDRFAGTLNNFQRCVVATIHPPLPSPPFTVPQVPFQFLTPSACQTRRPRYFWTTETMQTSGYDRVIQYGGWGIMCKREMAGGRKVGTEGFLRVLSSLSRKGSDASAEHCGVEPVFCI